MNALLTENKMPKKKEPDEDPKKQFKRFVEAAREHEVDESGDELEKAFKKVAPKARQKSKASN